MTNEHFKTFVQYIGDNILYHRKRNYFTQEELALRAGISLSNYCSIERGEANPTVATIKLIADALMVTPADLMVSHRTSYVGDLCIARLSGLLSSLPEPLQIDFMKVFCEILQLAQIAQISASEEPKER